MPKAVPAFVVMTSVPRHDPVTDGIVGVYETETARFLTRSEAEAFAEENEAPQFDVHCWVEFRRPSPEAFAPKIETVSLEEIGYLISAESLVFGD